MRIGVVELGRISATISGRLMRAGHLSVVWDANPAAIESVEADGATTASNLSGLVFKLPASFTRFRSRQQHTFAEKILSAMRFGMGGHVEPTKK